MSPFISPSKNFKLGKKAGMGENKVVLYHGSDKGNPKNPGIANGKAFACAAKYEAGDVLTDTRFAVDVSSWHSALTMLYNFAAAHGPIDQLMIIDHGLDGRQQLGNELLVPGRIMLLGCEAGADEMYLDEVAKAANADVIAWRNAIAYTCDPKTADKQPWQPIPTKQPDGSILPVLPPAVFPKPKVGR